MQFQIHIPTVIVALILGYALLAIQLSIPGQRPRSLALQWWNWGNWAVLAAFGVLFSRVWMPVLWSQIGGNVLFALGGALYSNAVYYFLHGRHAPRAMWVALGLCAFAMLAVAQQSFGVRTVVYSTGLAIMLIPGVWQIVRYGWFREPILRMVALSTSITLAGLVLRISQAGMHPEGFGEMAEPGTGPGLVVLTAYLAMLGSGFGFVLAVLERNVLQMEALATHDGLTDCLNRSAAIALLDNTLQRAHRTVEATSLVMLDLDHFKNINDRYGHRTGDEVLRRFAQAARMRLRASDVLARMGGEEFALILPNTDAIGAVHVAESVRSAIEALAISDLKEGTISITVSAGVACALGSTSTTADALYHRADTALYAAKAGGRNRIELAADL